MTTSQTAGSRYQDQDQSDPWNTLIELEVTGSAELDPVSGRHLSVNTAYCQITGYAQQELIGREISDLFEPEQLAAIEPLRNPGQAEAGIIQVRGRRNGGASVWFRITWKALTHSNRTVVALLLKDISDETYDNAAAGSNRTRQPVVCGTGPVNWHWNSRTDEVTFSEHLCVLLGYSKDELPARRETWISLLHPDDRDFVLERLRKHLDAQGAYDVEYRLRTRPGGYRWFHSRGRAVLDADGGIIRMAGSLVDIHDRAQTSEMLMNLQSALEGAEIAVMGLDGEGHVFLNQPPAGASANSAGEVLGTTLASSIVPEDVPLMESALKEAETVGHAYREVRRIRKDGSIFFQAITITPRSGDEPGYCCLMRDITTLKKEHEILALAVESAPNGILMISGDGSILRMNTEAERLFGYSREEVLGKPIETLIPERFRANHPGYRAHYAAAPLARRMGANADLHALRKDGVEVPVEIGINSVETTDGRIILCAIVDITERKKYESLLENAKHSAEAANRAKSDFLARMSHEIRTPMHLIMGTSSLLLESNLDTRQREQAQVFRRNAERLLHLINDILDISKIEAGKFNLSVERFHLREVIEDVMATTSSSAEHKGLKLDMEIADDIWPWLMGDHERLEQILLNLLGNAVKFTESGHIHLSVRRESEGSEEEHLRFEAADTGCGVPVAMRSAIFEQFQQADHGLTRRFGGSGLGLSIARSLVELMGGKIWLKDTSGPGTTIAFTARFPTVSHDAIPVSVPNVRKSTISAGGLETARILIVEDTDDNIFLLRSYLEGLPLQLDFAGNGAEAVRKVMSKTYDLVLMDIQMPVMDGYSATRAIRAWESSQGRKPVPILALTAHAFTEVAAESRAAGCDGHLSKPINKADLLQAISENSNWAKPANAAPPLGLLPAVKAALPKYLKRRRSDVEALREALVRLQFDEIRRRGHDMKGTGASYGCPAISEIGAALESTGRMGAAGEIGGLLERLDQTLTACEEMVNSN